MYNQEICRLLLPMNENHNQEGKFLIVDSCQDGAFYMDLNESVSKNGLTRFRGKFQEAEAINKNKRMYPFDVLDKNVQSLQEVIDQGGLIGELDHPCLIDPNFEVLTPHGWKRFKEMREGDTIYSRVDGKMVTSEVEAIIDEPYDGKTIHFKGRSIDCTFTAPHKTLLCKRSDSATGANDQYYISAEDLHYNRNKHSHSYIPKTAVWEEGKDKSFVTIKGVFRPRLKYADKDLNIDSSKFAAFLGLYLAEGNLSKEKSSNRIIINQRTEYGRHLVKSILSDFHAEIEWKEFRGGFYTSDARLYDYLVPLGNKYSKYIPSDIKKLSPRYLEKLIIAFAIGDGRIQKLDKYSNTSVNLKKFVDDFKLDNGTYTRINIFSVSEQLVNDLHECIIKCGYSGSRSILTDSKDYQYAGRLIKASSKKPLHVLNISRSKAIHADTRFLKTIEGHHTGRIFCLKVAYGNFYMKYNGQSFWTGNCDSVIHFANASHKITKIWWEGNVLMGEGEILTTPHGRLLKSLISDGVRVGISSRGVGNGSTNEDGVLVIGESYKLITFDAVADPSCHQAFQKEVVNRQKENYLPKTEINESKRIYKVKKEQVLACFGGIVKSKANELKARINNG